MMKISDHGLQLIMQFEGCVLSAYKDAVGVWTIGYGSTKNVKPGDHITQEEADELLQKDVEIFERCVEKEFAGHELTQGEFDALVSFAFNLGCGALHKSTLRRKLLAGDKRGASDEFMRWTHAGHRELAGLVRRRTAEREEFLA